MRLDKRVAEQFSLSRRRADAAVRHGQVDVEGHTCFDPAREVQPDTPLEYKPGRPKPETTARRLKVLYEDRDILIVDKPAGLLTQPTPDRERDTLLERAGRYLSQTRRLASPYVGIVHRIDKLTTGVVLLVCSPRALRPFQSLFRRMRSNARISRWSTAWFCPARERSTWRSCLTAETAAEAQPKAINTVCPRSPITSRSSNSGSGRVF